jgi:hypothetical protein
LLAESKLTFQSAYDLALQIEMARKNAAELSGVGSSKSGEMNNSPAEANFVRGKPFVKSNYAGTSYGSQKKKEGSFGQCKHCGANHEASGCRFQNATCYKCRKKGHIKPICRSSAAASTSTTDSTTKFISGDTDTEEDYVTHEQSFGLYHCSGNTDSRKPYIVNLKVDTKDVDFHVDTGSSHSIVSQNVYNDKFSQFPLVKTDQVLRSYTGDIVSLVGMAHVNVKYNDSQYACALLVASGSDRPSLLGRDWLSVIRLKWNEIVNRPRVFFINKSTVPKLCFPACPPDFNLLIDKNVNLFQPNSDGIRGLTASINLKPNVSPIFQKASPIPYAMQDSVNREYDRLVEAGILYPLEFSDWASPVVVVPKTNDKIRICGDYRRMNVCIEGESNKLPNVQDMFANLGCPKVFSVLDLRSAFNQLILDDDSAKLLVVDTHRGLFGTKRLAFGVKTAPSLFQGAMDKILSPKCIMFYRRRVDCNKHYGRTFECFISGFQQIPAVQCIAKS